MKYVTLIMISLLLAACGSGDAPEVTINSVNHNGTGCPTGTSSIVLTPDKKTVSVLFDGEYEAVAGAGSGLTEATDVSEDRVACNIAISLHIPSGYQAFLIGAGYRGEVSLPVGGEAEFTREYFFAGSSGEMVEENWSGEIENEEIQFFDELFADSNIYAACGEDVILRANSSLSISAPVAGDTALIQLDSFDYQNQNYTTQFDYHFNYVRCS
jgi:hypothetical protein